MCIAHGQRSRHHIGAALDPADQRRDLLRLLGEIGLERDYYVTPRIIGAPHHLAQ
jgi:hypothetical protein